MRRVVFVIAVCLLLPSPSWAGRKKKAAEPAPTVHTPGSELEALTVRVPGRYSRVSSADAQDDATIGPGESLVLASLEGPAIIDRLWIAVEGGATWWRDLVVRITWEGGSSPSVEAPIGDFFGVGPGARQNLQSQPIAVQSAGRSLTSYWKMPFATSARIELVNEGATATRQLRWEVEYRTVDSLPEGSLYFHAQYTQGNPPIEGRPLTVLRAAGSGQYVGMTLAAQNSVSGAWGTGSVHFVVDGREDAGPGSITVLNYFGNIFGVNLTDGPYQGTTLDEGDRPKARSSVYRFHVNDPVPFDSSIEIKLDHGVNNERPDRLGVVAYWYQDAPQVPFEKLALAASAAGPPPRTRSWRCGSAPTRSTARCSTPTGATTTTRR